MGAEVTAVCDTPSSELVKGLGADRVIGRIKSAQNVAVNENGIRSAT